MRATVVPQIIKILCDLAAWLGKGIIELSEDTCDHWSWLPTPGRGMTPDDDDIYIYIYIYIYI